MRFSGPEQPLTLTNTEQTCLTHAKRHRLAFRNTPQLGQLQPDFGNRTCE